MVGRVRQVLGLCHLDALEGAGVLPLLGVEVGEEEGSRWRCAEPLAAHVAQAARARPRSQAAELAGPRRGPLTLRFWPSRWPAAGGRLPLHSGRCSKRCARSVSLGTSGFVDDSADATHLPRSSFLQIGEERQHGPADRALETRRCFYIHSTMVSPDMNGQSCREAGQAEVADTGGKRHRVLPAGDRNAARFLGAVAGEGVRWPPASTLPRYIALRDRADPRGCGLPALDRGEFVMAENSPTARTCLLANDRAAAVQVRGGIFEDRLQQPASAPAGVDMSSASAAGVPLDRAHPINQFWPRHPRRPRKSLGNPCRINFSPRGSQGRGKETRCYVASEASRAPGKPPAGRRRRCSVFLGAAVAETWPGP